MKSLVIILTLLAITLVSCRHASDSSSARKNGHRTNMIETNKYLITKDRELILNYCERKGIEATETSTGLWYSVKSPGSGPLIKDGDIITFDYDCSLLDGTLCYTSATSGPSTTRFGYSTMESGLMEGIKLMRRGAEFIFIIPPYLAHGVPGDGNRIPGRAVIVYRIRILQE
jgi:FKBP-type peptidyl-prolyl cis-trans isomerase FkpA